MHEHAYKQQKEYYKQGQTSPRALKEAIIKKFYQEAEAMKEGRDLKQYEIEDKKIADELEKEAKSSIFKGLKRGAKVIDSLAQKEIVN